MNLETARAQLANPLTTRQHKDYLRQWIETWVEAAEREAEPREDVDRIIDEARARTLAIAAETPTNEL
jgi:hypothetical protein